ncbi:hypothetical protein BH11VER1_BH11VER1_14930 [soil metagenome]
MSAQSMTLRAIVIALIMIPYAFFGIRDLIHHKVHRHVSWTERCLHFMIGLSLTIIVPHAIGGHRDVVIPGLFLFLIARVTDEWFFHRQLDAAESDIHAKTHLGFLIFVVGMLVLENR